MESRRDRYRALPGPQAIAGRVPPHDLDAEAAVLSACMLSRTAIERVLPILKPEHFYSDSNGRIYEAIGLLVERGIPVDIVNVASFLRDRERLHQIGGASYLAQLADATPAVAHVASHAEVVFEKWRLRQLISTCQIVAAEGYGDVGIIHEFVSAGAAAVAELALLRRSSSLQPMRIVLQSAMNILCANAEGRGMAGRATGYDRLDAKTAGLHDGELTIIAARPGMGKTSFVCGIGVNVAFSRFHEVESPVGKALVEEPGAGVIVFSLEMPREQIATRMVCSEARVDLGKVRLGFLTPDDWRRLTEAASQLSALPIWIDDTPAIDLMEIRAKVRQVQAEYNRDAVLPDPSRGIEGQPARRIGLVVIDYLQLMKGREGVHSREQEISEISRGLKQLAKELSVPVIALSQLNRAVETRGKDKRPQLSDLRESGAIEQDSDTIIFIYRDEYYNPETTNARGIAELIVAKQRNGPTGKVLTRFTSSCTRFDNLAPGDYPELDTDE